MIGRYIKKQGYIYCLDNECYKYISENMYKIGMTENCKNRLLDYNNNFIEKGTFIYTTFIEDMYLAELITFIKLREYRLYDDKEIFICHKDIIKKTFDEICKLFEDTITLDIILNYLGLLEYKEDVSGNIYNQDVSGNIYNQVKKIYIKNIRKILNNQINSIIEIKGNKSYEESMLSYYKAKKISQNLDKYKNFEYNNDIFMKKLSKIKNKQNKIFIIQGNEYKYYNENLYKIIITKNNKFHKDFITQYTSVKYKKINTSNIISTFIVINEMLKNNIFNYNYYKIYDLDLLVNKINNILNASNSNNLIENYLLLKNKSFYRNKKFCIDTSSEEEEVNVNEEIKLLNKKYNNLSLPLSNEIIYKGGN